MSIKLNKPVSILENEYPDYEQYFLINCLAYAVLRKATVQMCNSKCVQMFKNSNTTHMEIYWNPAICMKFSYNISLL